MSLWKSILVLLISLWLPVQGYGAVAMPFCAHGGAGSEAAATDTGGDHNGHGGHGSHAGHEMASGDQHSAGHHGDTVATADQGSNLACNDCGACHLACSPALLSPVSVLAPRNTTVFDLPETLPLLSFTPERLQRPPLSALA